MTNATPLNSVKIPVLQDIGYCDQISVKEIGSTKVTIIERKEFDDKVCSIVLRGSSNAFMENIQRSLESGVSAYKAMFIN